ncbi:hypothetical protein OAB00_00305, partial [Akkermansiaceae bacterium]|nr:hypothetical protein [Akkermansiaceae bacterium]
GFSLMATEHGFTEAELSRRSELDMNPESFQQFDLPPFTLESLDEYKQKNANGAYKMELLEVFLSAGDPEVSKVLEGIKIEVEGALRSQPGEEDNLKVKRLYRMIMQCCAADMQAIPMKLILSDESAASLESVNEHDWIVIEATIGYETDQHGIKQAFLNVTSSEKGSPPASEVFLTGRGSSLMQNKL